MTVETVVIMVVRKVGLGTLDEQFKYFEALHKEGLESVKYLKEIANKPAYDKQPKTYSISEVERIIDIPRSTIRDNESRKEISYEDASPGSRKNAYTLKDVNILREFFNKGFFNGHCSRPEHLPPIVLATAMFKGGVGKTTQSSHLAAHCAITGLKTLFIDLDPQASGTLTLGYVPSIDLEPENTIYNALLNDPQDIVNVIKPTHYHGLDIITSGLELQGADILLPNFDNNNAERLGSPLLRLKKALMVEEIKKYDVILLDCAPNHAAVTMNALTAADGVILPVTPSMLAYGSSIQFIETLKELTQTLIKYRDELRQDEGDHSEELELLNNISNKLFTILVTNDEGNSENEDTGSAIQSLYSNHVLKQHMVHTIALPRTSNDLALLYDMKRSDIRGSKESFDRGLFCMKEVNDGILSLLKSVWGIS